MGSGEGDETTAGGRRRLGTVVVRRPAVAALLRAVPRGATLPETVWRRRHRWMVLLLAAHGPALLVGALVAGVGTGLAVLHGLVPVLFAAVAITDGPRRRVRATVVGLGLLTCSAGLVHVSGGVIEAHFHYFVVIAVLALYEDWWPFLLAIGYVVLQHGLMGAADPDAVFDRSDPADAWRWALVHGVFISAAAAANVIAWRMNEDVRDEVRAEVAARRASERRLAETAKALDTHARRLERSNADLEQFAYVASHDLSEPLRMISSSLGLIRRHYTDGLHPEAVEFMGYAVDGAGRMRAMIDDLMAYARLEADELVLEDVDMQALVERTLHTLTPAVDASGGRVDVDQDLPTVRGDAGRLAQLMQNLLANALKFRRDAHPSTVRVTARRDGDVWRFAVVDDGVGIPPEHAGRVFLMFQRLHARDRFPGNGIGLAICRRVVELHGGEIRVEPTPGGGTTVVFTLQAAG